jgi:hypothetical protein
MAACIYPTQPLQFPSDDFSFKIQLLALAFAALLQFPPVEGQVNIVPLLLHHVSIDSPEQIDHGNRCC